MPAKKTNTLRGAVQELALAPGSVAGQSRGAAKPSSWSLLAPGSNMGLLAPPRNLQRDRLSVPYQERLKVAGEWFARWCARRELEMAVLSQNPKLMTGALVAYLQALYDHGFALWLGVHTVLWAQTEFRELKGQLRSAWDSVSSWRLSRPVTSRVPMPEAVMRALVCRGVLSATTMEKRCAHMWWNFSVVVPFAFFGLMRPQELFGLKKEHIRLPGPQSFVQEPSGHSDHLQPEEPSVRRALSAYAALASAATPTAWRARSRM